MQCSEGKNMNPDKNTVFQKNGKQTFFWNMAGGFCNSITSFLLLLFVTRILGSDEAGIFSFAFATAQLMLTIGKFGMRAYQATDVNEIIGFPSYLVSRMISCLLMLAASWIYIIWNGYEGRKLWIILLVCLIKIPDAVEDVFHGELQRIGKLDLAGKLLTLRNVLTIFVFTATLILSRDLQTTCFTAAFFSIVVTLWLNLWYTSRWSKISIHGNAQQLKGLFAGCLPLFVASFLSLYIYNAPKNAIDSLLAYEYQTYYSILFMPAFVINLFSEFAFKPVLTNLAVSWDKKDIQSFSKSVFTLLGLIVVLTIVVILGASILGIPVLSLVYGVDLSPYKTELLVLLSGGGFGAGAYFLYNVLTSMRKQGIILTGYATVAILVTVLSPKLVEQYHMFGAAMSYFCSIMALFLFFFIMLFVIIIVRKQTINNQVKTDEGVSNYSGI